MAVVFKNIRQNNDRPVSQLGTTVQLCVVEASRPDVLHAQSSVVVIGMAVCLEHGEDILTALAAGYDEKDIYLDIVSNQEEIFRTV